MSAKDRPTSKPASDEYRSNYDKIFKKDAPMNDAAIAISELMDKWNAMEKLVRYLCPEANEDQVREKTRAAMDLAVQTLIERKTQ